jgi:hypothetical protein
MLGKVQKFEGLTPWEAEHQTQQKRLEERLTFTRYQWKTKGMHVVVEDQEARRSIVTRAGNTLHLFSADQVRPRTQAELERDAWRGQ